MSQPQRYEWRIKAWIKTTIFTWAIINMCQNIWLNMMLSIPLATVCCYMLLSYVLYPSNISFQFARHLDLSCSPGNSQIKVTVLRENTALRENVASLLSEAHLVVSGTPEYSSIHRGFYTQTIRMFFFQKFFTGWKISLIHINSFHCLHLLGWISFDEDLTWCVSCREIFWFSIYLRGRH